jgi:hypothetical protein
MERLQLLIVRKVPDHAMPADEIDRGIAVGVDLARLQRGAETPHEGLSRYHYQSVGSAWQGCAD